VPRALLLTYGAAEHKKQKTKSKAMAKDKSYVYRWFYNQIANLNNRVQFPLNSKYYFFI